MQTLHRRSTPYCSVCPCDDGIPSLSDRVLRDVFWCLSPPCFHFCFFSSQTGTSMAAPLVAGACASVWVCAIMDSIRDAPRFLAPLRKMHLDE
jgi:hypothetical protein